MSNYLAIIGASLILEDPTTLYVSTLISENKISWTEGFCSLMLGLALGDLGLYLIGRFLRRVRPPHLAVQLKGIKGAGFIFVSRFLPGARIVVYSASGYFRFPLAVFLLVNLTSCAIWTAILLQTGGAIFKKGGWPMVASSIVLLLLLSWHLKKKFSS